MWSAIVTLRLLASSQVLLTCLALAMSNNLSWHHFWFVAYLFLFCIVGWPVFGYVRSASGAARLVRWSAWLRAGMNLYWFVVPLMLLELPLRALFPGFRDLVHDWASFLHWFAVFLAGYCFASDRMLLDRTQHIRWRSLMLALATTAILFTVFWTDERALYPIIAEPIGQPIEADQISVVADMAFCVVRMANVWFWLLVCLGFAGRHLQRPSPALAYLNDAVYPLFCIHLTLIVAFDFLVVPLDWPVAAKFLSITTAAIVVALVAYELVIRRFAWLRPLFGLKPRSSQSERPFTAHEV